MSLLNSNTGNYNNLQETDHNLSEVENTNINSKKNDNRPIETEMTTVISFSTEGISQETILSQMKKPIIKEEENPFSEEMVFGSSINEPQPKFLGNTRVFWYYNNKPLIVIGPDCKFLINNNLFFFYIF